MPYMNVTEVESALIALAAAHPTLCELITLPNLTLGNKTSHAVRLGTQAANTVDAFYLTGGVHAREWGSCEILVNLAVDLCDAYAGNTGLTYGGKAFSATEIKALMEQMNVIIFPCVNPDGREFSQTTDGMWRKNRNPESSGGNAARIGVDINRNQDFLWDFPVAFAPSAVNVFLSSTDPGDDTFHGTEAFSERETKNINFIHDTFTRIKWYIDVHSYSESILFVWGDDESQFSESNKNFLNATFDGQRGVLGDSYKEFIPDGDLSALQGLAGAFTRSLGQVRGKLYVAKPAFSLYPTSGTNNDYAYSRHFADPSKSNALSFTLEWGTEFQPLWTEMEEIIKDVSAGLIGLGLKALGIESFIVSNRDTFSSVEVETTTSFPESFYVIYDGFTPASLGVPGASPTLQFQSTISGGPPINTISAVLTATELENPGAPNTPQRISFTFRVDFQNTSAFNAEIRDIFLRASFVGIQDVALVRLTTQPNPYMLDGAVTWLSTDLRVFQLRPGEKINGSNVELGNLNNNANAAHAYIQALLVEMRGFGNNPAPPFENLPQDQAGSQLELSRTVDGDRVCNFAVAKVRYRANTQDAVNVRVFFRTFNTMVSDLSYTTNPFANVQNYRRSPAGTIPLLGTNAFFSGAGNQIVSIPYFAEARINSATQSMTAQSDNTNRQTVVHAGATEALQYFGVWLDFNQTEPQFPVNVPSGSDGPFSGRVSILQLMRGIHTCMAAEIRFQPGAVDPIPNGATPSSSNRLSQRNLAIVESDNPGTVASHTVQHTLLMKPSKTAARLTTAALATTGANETGGRFDELVIRWRDLPRDTQASIFCPDWNADEILEVANRSRVGAQKLSKLDDNTIACVVGDISYIPVPARQDPMPALLTLKLPLTVRDGEDFLMDVQQHSGPIFQRRIREGGDDIEGIPPTLKDVNFSARKVLGAFRLRVVVKIGEPLIGKLVRNLAVLRYIFEAIPVSDSWHPVFVRYIKQLGDQVRDLGVDPDLVPASPDDPGIPGRPVEERDCVTGKVVEVIYDCFGDFDGFVLETCDCKRHRFDTRKKGIGEVVLRACTEGHLISVCVSRKCNGKISEIIVKAS